jgi:phage terminase small subunit
MSDKGLTPKQENFCREFIKCGNASEAYRKAYNCDNMKPETINVKACELLKNGNITVRVQELDKEKKNEAIADAQEIQETLTRLLRGEEQEECVAVESIGDYQSRATIIKKQVTPKDRIKAGETLAKMRGYFDITIKLDNKPIIKDDI